ncbi:MAG TPA: hypothetical protein VHE61_22400 [Opitutaceae bacterium]|nr:hypothetical protein [Opitutaceae bacterium]
MFANLVQLLSGRPAPQVEHNAFVKEVRVGEREKRNPKVERLILICWLLIAVKHVFVLWAVYHYHVPFNALWVNFPTWMLGVLATGLYFSRVRRR